MQQMADDPGGADCNLLGRQTQFLSCPLGHSPGLVQALGTSAGIGIARVDDHGSGTAFFEDSASPYDRSGPETIGCEDPHSRVHGSTVDDQGQVAALGASRTVGDGGASPEACRIGDAHGATPMVVSPVSSGRPKARFTAWRAWPAVPRVRLSMAEKA